MFLMETNVTGHAFKTQVSHYFTLPTLPGTPDTQQMGVQPDREAY